MPEVRQQRSPVVIAFIIALALLLIWPAWTAARHGLSDLYARPAIDYLESKLFDADSLSETDWTTIENNVVYADELMAHNPQYLEALGQLHQLKLSLFADELSIEEMDAHARAAHDYYLRSIANRPTWPYYWGNVALEHYRRGNYAAIGYSQALANASRFGPWKDDTQRLVMDLGGETWEFLSPPAKREFILNIERSLHRQPRNAVRIVHAYSVWPEVCDAGARQPDISLPRLQSLCSQEGFAQSSYLPTLKNGN